jgi:hypothetical protein
VSDPRDILIEHVKFEEYDLENHPMKSLRKPAYLIHGTLALEVPIQISKFHPLTEQSKEEARVHIRAAIRAKLYNHFKTGFYPAAQEFVRSVEFVNREEFEKLMNAFNSLFPRIK